MVSTNGSCKVVDVLQSHPIIHLIQERSRVTILIKQDQSLKLKGASQNLNVSTAL